MNFRWSNWNPLVWIDALLDEFWDRADLWKDKENRVSDFQKVRSWFLYNVVGITFGYLVWKCNKLPVVYIITIPLAMLSLSAGENVFMSFLDAWKERKDVLTGDLEKKIEDVVAKKLDEKK